MTSRSTWKNAERAIARFHNPEEGRRTPLSGMNSGITHSDAVGVDGMFIETKYRKTWALWSLYSDTKFLAKKECKIPVVAIREKGKKGFIDLIHSDYLDAYVQMYIRNRCIVVDSTKNVMVGETILTHFFTGTHMQVDFLLRHLTHLSFDANGCLRENWWKKGGEKLTIHLRFSEGFGVALYGAFPHPLKVDPTILSEHVSEAMGEVSRENKTAAQQRG